MATNAGVFVLKDEHTLVAMRTASFASEDDFQRLLAAFPELLAGDQIDAEVPRRFILVSREQSVASEEGGSGRWSLDHLFLDQDGVPTLVEVKRGTDTRIRREVVGQMLDYAANCVLYWPIDELRAQFSARCQERNCGTDRALADLIFDGDETRVDAEAYWGQVRANLLAGRVRLLFVADRIPPELRRIVEFLNRQMQPAEVLAVELRQYEGQGLRTLVPLVLGQTQEAAQKKATGVPQPKRVWDQASFFAELEAKYEPDVVRGMHRIADWINAKAARVHFNTAATWGSMGPVFERDGQSLYPFLIHTDGTLGLYFQYMMARPVFDAVEMRRELLGRLNSIRGVSLPDDVITRRPGIRLSVFADERAVDEFLAAMDWFVAQFRSNAAALDPVRTSGDPAVGPETLHGSKTSALGLRKS